MPRSIGRCPAAAQVGRLNHVAIAVPDLAAASARYRDVLGAKVGHPALRRLGALRPWLAPRSPPRRPARQRAHRAAHRARSQVSEPQPVPEHGVTVVFVELPNTKIELLHPLGDNSPIAKFLQRNPAGGIHHMCLEVRGRRRRRPPLRAAWRAAQAGWRGAALRRAAATRRRRSTRAASSPAARPGRARCLAAAQVGDVQRSMDGLGGRIRVLDPKPKIGAHGNPVSWQQYARQRAHGCWRRPPPRRTLQASGAARGAPPAAGRAPAGAALQRARGAERAGSARALPAGGVPAPQGQRWRADGAGAGQGALMADAG